MTEALQRLGVEVTSVADGAAAVEAIQSARTAGNSGFDLVFMDGSMPVLDGFEAARAIRTWESENHLPPVPIVALTAHVVGRQKEAWRDAGMQDIVHKPFTLATIAACLERWVGERRDQPVGQPVPAEEQPQNHRDLLIDTGILAEIRDLQSSGDDLVGRIIDLYLEHAPQLLDALIEALPKGNTDQIADAAHALKSVCRNIGAVRLGDACDLIEEAARAGDTTELAATDAHALCATFNATSDALKALAATAQAAA